MRLRASERVLASVGRASGCCMVPAIRTVTASTATMSTTCLRAARVAVERRGLSRDRCTG